MPDTPRIPSILQGLPDDLLTTDFVYHRAVKVAIDNLAQVEETLVVALSQLIESNKCIEKQMRLLNARAEEAWDTGIEVSDL